MPRCIERSGIGIAAILVATAVPWLASGFEVDVGPASVGLLGLGAVHVALSALGAPSRLADRWRARALAALHIAGVILIGFIWRHVGALQNPLFLSVFSLPVLGAILLSRWQPYAVAATAIGVVAVAAFAQVPELRWYVSGLIGGGSDEFFVVRDLLLRPLRRCKI